MLSLENWRNIPINETKITNLFPGQSFNYCSKNKNKQTNNPPLLLSLRLSGGTVRDAPRPCWLMYLLWKQGSRLDEKAAAQHPADIFTSGRRSTSPPPPSVSGIIPRAARLHRGRWYSHPAATRELLVIGQLSVIPSLFKYIRVIMFYMTSGLNHQSDLSPSSGQREDQPLKIHTRAWDHRQEKEKRVTEIMIRPKVPSWNFNLYMQLSCKLKMRNPIFVDVCLW